MDCLYFSLSVVLTNNNYYRQVAACEDTGNGYINALVFLLTHCLCPHKQQLLSAGSCL